MLRFMSFPDLSVAPAGSSGASASLLWGSIAIEAAGGVLWRYAPDGSVEVALVHRPKYDDWSVPKGKLKRREHLLLGAVREVEEETGARITLGRPLGEIRYLKEGLPKRVRYWSMFAVDSLFVEGDEGDEVDELRWLRPGDALGRLSYERDVPAIERFLADLRPTWPLVLARHGSAGDRASWTAEDALRPLDEVGEEQAAVLGSVLTAYGVTSVHSADVARCVDTVSGYATSVGTTVVAEPAMSEAGWADHDLEGLERLLTLAQTRVATVLSSQRGSIPGLLAGLLSALGAATPPDLSTRKGGFWVLHLAAPAEPEGLPELVALERFEPAPQRT